jgi:isoleucyl-tRNA synthetase
MMHGDEETNKRVKTLPEREEEILKFWKENLIFEKTVEKDAPGGEFVFYDGPPFATGLPHYGHLLAGTIKDVIPRFETMRGKRVWRRWGWDCHGLPLENIIESELGIKTKKDIEKMGVDVFNEAARKAVMRYARDWKQIIPRTGRWVDMERDYKTMDASYTESIWWIFKNLYEKGLIYKGFKSMHLCPRCETTLSNFEVSQGYKDIADIAVTVKFRLLPEKDEKLTTYLLAWTTTAWTLPGNTAIGVHPEIVYVKVRVGNEQYIVAQALVEKVFQGREYVVMDKFAGKELVGRSYEPPFPYFYKHRNDSKGIYGNSWKVYPAPYVTTDEGTGIVHLAPAFGEEDMELAEKYGIRLVHHVDTSGRFTEAVSDFKGKPVKSKDDHQSTDIEIVKYLAQRNLLFAKEKITHSYPFCWRCDTPLLNYAAESWFVKVSALRSSLVEENKKILWVPREVGEGRFGKWIEGARDWAISRSRFWGAPIPIWQCGSCEKVEAIGSLEEIKAKVSKSGNKYFVMRHGEAENNVEGVVSSKKENSHHLTDKGRDDVGRRTIEFLRTKGINLIIASPFIRTKETALIVARGLGLDESAVLEDERLGEVDAGDFNGGPVSTYRAFFKSLKEKFFKTPPSGENLYDVRRRVGSFLYDLEKKYSKTNILIVTHESPAWLLTAVAEGTDLERTMELRGGEEEYIKTSEARELPFVVIPHNGDYEIDFHRPYIDAVNLACSCGGEARRVSEVFDCWFESGSMPYGQFHYPFDSAEHKKFEKIFNPEKNIGFPADFIAEGLDQTRGWFYSMLVISVALFGRSAYRAVVVNGVILSEDGQKMSKRLKNYPDPMDIIGRYGADSLRYYLLTSPAVRGDEFNFSEKGVAEVMRKVFMRLYNVLAFYRLYVLDEAETEKAEAGAGKHILDRWILARLNELINEVTGAMEKYELDRASRPVWGFVDDLSVWYLRRSRERFKGDDENDKHMALKTLQHVLNNLAKIMAPFAPFFAEYMYQKVNRGRGRESVHLEEWPSSSSMASDELEILETMEEVRRIVSLALEARSDTNIRVRQPLASLKVKNTIPALKGSPEILQLIKDEVNVKRVIFDDGIKSEVEIDCNITDELKREGQMRELMRRIQDLRKKQKLTPRDLAVLQYETDDRGEKLIKTFADDIRKVSILSSLERVGLDEDAEKATVDDIVFKLLLKVKNQ